MRGCVGAARGLRAGGESSSLALFGCSKLAPCDGPDASAACELQGNWQIKLSSSDMCLQSGAAPGNADLAASSSVIATSTLGPAHRRVWRELETCFVAPARPVRA